MKQCDCETFPTFPVLLFVLSVVWFFSELGIIAFDIPWWPIILMLLSFNMLLKFYHFQSFHKK